MTPIEKKNIQRFGKILGPALSALALGALITGCAPTPTPPADGGAMQSQDAASSAMMQNSTMSEESTSTQMPPSGMMQNPQGMMPTEGLMHQAVYKDGTYSAQGNYMSPGGSEIVDVSLTIKDDTIAVATFKGEAQMGKSQKMQEMFAAGYQAEVVGKAIDSLNLTVVNGSSLTPMGFMDAVAKIKAEAKA